jgi:hypothetical protein
MSDWFLPNLDLRRFGGQSQDSALISPAFSLSPANDSYFRNISLYSYFFLPDFM